MASIKSFLVPDVETPRDFAISISSAFFIFFNSDSEGAEATSVGFHQPPLRRFLLHSVTDSSSDSSDSDG